MSFCFAVVSRGTIVLLFLLDSPVSSYPSYSWLIYDQVLSLYFLLTGYFKLSFYIIINLYRLSSPGLVQPFKVGMGRTHPSRRAAAI